jgi:putative methyltransferase
MRTNLKQHHVKCVRLKCQDFLSTDPEEYEKVEYILLDPSCSGSGMINRYKYGTIDDENVKDEKRLWYLEALQRKMLKHAMSFPNVKRIVYSTCSIHEEENENVVLYGLKHCNNRFKLENIFPEWQNRGHKTTEKSSLSKREFNLDYCIRTGIKDNLTNGFFVACFVVNVKDNEDENDECNEENDGAENHNEDLEEIPTKKLKTNDIL